MYLRSKFKMILQIKSLIGTQATEYLDQTWATKAYTLLILRKMSYNFT